MGSSGSHNFHKPYQPKVYGNRFCMKKTLIRGELHVCNEPTEGGKTYCSQCERRLITLTDRVPATPAQTKHVDWRFEGATRRNRRKKAA